MKIARLLPGFLLFLSTAACSDDITAPDVSATDTPSLHGGHGFGSGYSPSIGSITLDEDTTATDSAVGGHGFGSGF